MRKVININQKWKFINDGNAAFENVLKRKASNVNLPHTWNNLDGQDGGGNFYRGTCFYYKKLGKIELAKEEVAYLEFEGVHSIADVYLNGKEIFHHEGGFSTFRVRIDEVLNDENLLVVKVDNSANDYIYPQWADFTFFGGIYRNVNLIITNKVHFDLDYYGGPGVAVTPTVNGTNADVHVDAYVNEKENVELNVELLDGAKKVVKTFKTSELSFDFAIENVHLWDGIEDPYLYTLRLSLLKDGNVVDNKEVRFGVRTFSIDPDKGFFLNGRSYPLRGVSRHQDRYNMGWAITRKEHEEDMALIKEVGANTIRLAHYQHDQYFYDLCDENGMVVWAEIPFISMHLVKGRANTVSQMKELVIQNYNHPSIVVWGLSNEITMGGENEELLDNHRELNDLCHELDKTRLTTMAQVSMLDVHSEMNQVSDILSYNHYFGWYGGDVADNAEWFDEFHKLHPTRCFGVSEYGCEAILKWHTSKPEQGDYSEEYQCYYHHQMLETFATRPYLWATHVWNMFDFAADNRDEGGVKGRNNKGLVTYDRKTKKDSFYLYQAYWRKEPMLHLAKKRYIYRNEDVTQVLVYSNMDEVSLYVNGLLQETKKGSHVFEFKVKLEKSTTKLMVKAGNLTDTSIVKKVKKPYTKYVLAGATKNVANWFDADGKELEMTFDENYFSIRDKIKNIMANPEGKAVMDAFIAKMMSQMAESGMDLPKGAMKMLESFTIERIGKLAGDKFPAESIAELNKVLQKIKK